MPTSLPSLPSPSTDSRALGINQTQEYRPFEFNRKIVLTCLSDLPLQQRTEGSGEAYLRHSFCSLLCSRSRGGLIGTVARPVIVAATVFGRLLRGHRWPVRCS